MSDLPVIQSMQFEGEDIIFIEHEGRKLYPVYSVGIKFGYSEKNALEAFRNNLKFLEGNHYSLKIRRFKNAVSVPCLTGEGVLIYSSRLGIERLPEDRQDKIIRTVQFMAKAAMGVIEGKLVPVKSQLDYFEERVSVADNHKLLMAAVKRYEAPKYPGNSRIPYQKESKAINEDIAGVHISGMNDMLNTSGLRVKNDAYVSDRTLLIAGVPFESRHQVVKQFIDETYPRRTLCDMLLTVEERARVTRKCPASQRGISDFMAVTV